MAPSATLLLLPFLLLLTFTATSAAPGPHHNITAILSGHPSYSLFNSYLTQTRLADDINSHSSITVLLLPNPVLSSLLPPHPLSSLKNALRLLVLLDYFDPQKLHSLPQSTNAATLLQTTGLFPSTLGFLTISNRRGGKVSFSSSYPDDPSPPPPALYVKNVVQFPTTLSLLEVSRPITFPGLLTPSSDTANFTDTLVSAGCKTFASLLVSSGVIRLFEGRREKGITILAPNDEAFKKATDLDLGALSQAELVALLQYHGVPEYYPKSSFESRKAPVSTLASSGAGKYEIGVITKGDDVSFDTGVDSSRLAGTVIDEPPVALFTVDSVLLPVELFGNKKKKGVSGAPAAAPGAEVPAASAPGGEADAPAVGAPAPKPSKKRKKAPARSPEVAPADGSVEAPAGGPDGDAVADDVKEGDLAAADHRDQAMAVSVAAAAAAAAAACLMML